MIITNAWIRTLVHDNDLEVYVIMKFFIDTANVDYIKEANDTVSYTHLTLPTNRMV